MCVCGREECVLPAGPGPRGGRRRRRLWACVGEGNHLSSHQRGPACMPPSLPSLGASGGSHLAAPRRASGHRAPPLRGD